jgi:hypothetical protein
MPEIVLCWFKFTLIACSSLLYRRSRQFPSLVSNLPSVFMNGYDAVSLIFPEQTIIQMQDQEIRPDLVVIQ